MRREYWQALHEEANVSVAFVWHDEEILARKSLERFLFGVCGCEKIFSFSEQLKGAVTPSEASTARKEDSKGGLRLWGREDDDGEAD